MKFPLAKKSAYSIGTQKKRTPRSMKKKLENLRLAFSGTKDLPESKVNLRKIVMLKSLVLIGSSLALAGVLLLVVFFTAIINKDVPPSGGVDIEEEEEDYYNEKADTQKSRKTDDHIEQLVCYQCSGCKYVVGAPLLCPVKGSVCASRIYKSGTGEWKIIRYCTLDNGKFGCRIDGKDHVCICNRHGCNGLNGTATILTKILTTNDSSKNSKKSTVEVVRVERALSESVIKLAWPLSGHGDRINLRNLAQRSKRSAFRKHHQFRRAFLKATNGRASQNLVEFRKKIRFNKESNSPVNFFNSSRKEPATYAEYNFDMFVNSYVKNGKDSNKLQLNKLTDFVNPRVANQTHFLSKRSLTGLKANQNMNESTANKAKLIKHVQGILEKFQRSALKKKINERHSNNKFILDDVKLEKENDETSKFEPSSKEKKHFKEKRLISYQENVGKANVTNLASKIAEVDHNRRSLDEGKSLSFRNKENHVAENLLSNTKDKKRLIVDDQGVPPPAGDSQLRVGKYFVVTTEDRNTDFIVPYDEEAARNAKNIILPEKGRSHYFVVPKWP